MGAREDGAGEKGFAMPELSRFRGMIISMFYNDVGRHGVAHFHVRYGDYEASFDLQGELLAGELPVKQAKLIAAWVVLHGDELEENWYLAQSGGTCYRIDAL